MRFMLLRKADKKTEAGVLPDAKLLTAMGNYMEEMVKAGVLLGGEGLQPSSKGARVKFSAGNPTVSDGPLTQAGLIAGFCLIQVKSREEAIDWVKRWPQLDGDGEIEIEIRQVYEAADFGAEFTPDLREAEERMRAQVSAKP
jgi:hypothetical protein